MHNLRVPHPVDQDEQLLVAWNHVVEPTRNEMVKNANIMRTTQPPCSNLHLSEIAGFINCAFPTHIECDPDSCITMFLDLAPQTIGGELSQWWGEPAPWDAWCEHQSVGAGLWAVYCTKYKHKGEWENNVEVGVAMIECLAPDPSIPEEPSRLILAGEPSKLNLAESLSTAVEEFERTQKRPLRSLNPLPQERKYPPKQTVEDPPDTDPCPGEPEVEVNPWIEGQEDPDSDSSSWVAPEEEEMLFFTS